MSDVVLHHGDCIAGLATLADLSVDCCITDPPYGIHTHTKQWRASALTDGRHRSGKVVRSQHASLPFAALSGEQAEAICRELARVTKRWNVAFTDLEGIALWRAAIESAGLEYVRTCIWDKVDSAPQFTGDRPASAAEAIVVFHRKGRKRWNGGGRRNVFRYEINSGSGNPTHKAHPTTKPLALMRELVSLFTDPGDLVLDPFAGSGTTGVACRMLGRRFVGWELDANYHAIATRRLNGEEAKPRLEQPSLFGGGL